MRKYHRWLSVIFGVFLLWISITGVVSQIPMWGEMFGGEGDGDRPVAAAPAVPAGFTCPESMVCRPKPSGSRSWVGLVHHLHSGETFGPLGTVIATLSGLALVFFSFSGLWLYISMWRNRSSRSLKPGWFWK
ncbi:MAG: PepSY domain-containing protein [Novosphingobium sp.]